MQLGSNDIFLLILKEELFYCLVSDSTFFEIKEWTLNRSDYLDANRVYRRSNFMSRHLTVPQSIAIFMVNAGLNCPEPYYDYC